MTFAALPPSQALIDLVGTLGGTWHGRTAMCRCPVHADTRPSLSIRQGDHGILVTCFAGCDRIDVLRALRDIRPARHFPHVDHGQGMDGGADRLWAAGLPVEKSLAERYLRARRLWPVTDDLRFHPRCPCRPRPWTSFQPALLVAVRENQRLTAVQRIFLDHETARYRMKLMIGRPGHGAWRGAGQETPVLAIAEGFETARAFTILKDIPCWASLGARRLDQLIIPARVTRLLIAGDNDEAGTQAADRAERAYARPGLVIERAPPPAAFKDWAQLLEA